MKPDSVPSIGRLILAGFVMVVVGTVGNLVAIPRLAQAESVYLLALPVGLGFVGWAAWQWSSIMHTDIAFRTTVRRSLRAVALAAAVLAVGYGTITIHWIRIALHPNTTIYRGQVLIGSLGLCVVGFCFAALGFWIASNARGPVPRPGIKTDSVDISAS
jgi:hypothetical protein